MAYTTIHPIKSTLGKALKYICNPEKTDGELLISSFGCSYPTADIEFGFTLEQSKMKKGDNLAHHLVQSFSPGETTPEKAHEIGKLLAAEVTKGEYEYVVTTHIDKGHVHNHIMLCATNFITYGKYNSNKKSLAQIRRTSDRLCKEHGLSIIIPKTENRKGFIEYVDENGEKGYRETFAKQENWNQEKGTGVREELRKAIDRYIEKSSSFEKMLSKMEADGFAIKRAKYHSYKLPNASPRTRFTGSPTLGVEYTDERIKERIKDRKRASHRVRPKYPLRDPNKINLCIEIEKNVKAQESAAYANKLKIVNLKEAAKALNYLTENHILYYEDLQGKITETQDTHRETLETLKQVEDKAEEMRLLIKNIEIYEKTKPYYDDYAQAKDKGKYGAFESKIILHQAAKKTLSQSKKLYGNIPSMDILRKEYSGLQVEKELLYKDYGKLKKDIKKLDILKANVDNILGISQQKEREQEKENRKNIEKQ